MASGLLGSSASRGLQGLRLRASLLLLGQVEVPTNDRGPLRRFLERVRAEPLHRTWIHKRETDRRKATRLVALGDSNLSQTCSGRHTTKPHRSARGEARAPRPPYPRRVATREASDRQAAVGEGLRVVRALWFLVC